VIGLLQRGMMIAHLTNPTGVHFDIAKFNWLGSLATETAVTVALTDAPVKTTQDLFTKELIVGGTSGSDPETTPRLYNSLIGTRFKIVNGYTGTNEAALAMERGEVQGIGDWSWSSFMVQRPDWLRDGKVRILLQFGNTRLPQLPDVPTAIELASSDADKTMLRFYGLKFTMARPLLIPPQVPAERTAALQAAFAATMQDAEYVEEARRIGLDTNWLGADALADRVRDIAATPQAVVDHVHELLARGGVK